MAFSPTAAAPVNLPSVRLVRDEHQATAVVPSKEPAQARRLQPPVMSRRSLSKVPRSTTTRGFRTQEAKPHMMPQEAGSPCFMFSSHPPGPFQQALWHGGLVVAHGLNSSAHIQKDKWSSLLSLGLVHLAALMTVLAVGFLGSRFPPARLPPLLATLIHLGLVVSRMDLESATIDRFAQSCAAAACLQAAATCLYPASGLTWSAQAFLLALGLLLEGLLHGFGSLELACALCLSLVVTVATAVAAGSVGQQTCRAVLWEMVLGQQRDSEELRLRAALQLFLEPGPSHTPLQKRAELTREVLGGAPLRPTLKGVLQELMSGLENKPPVGGQDLQMAGHLADAPPMVRQFVQQVLTPMISDRSLGILPSPCSSVREEDVLPRLKSRSSSISTPTPDEWETFLSLLVNPQVKKCSVPPPPPAHEALQLMSQGLAKWGFDLFRLCEVTHGRPLVHVALAVTHELTTMLEIPPDQFTTFVDSVEALYKPRLPYHNSIHAADVVNNLLFFLKLRSTPFAGTLDPVDELAAIVAAAAHDVGHSGRNNHFHVVAQTPSAQLFNDQHCLEHMHCALTFAVMRKADANFMEELCETARQRFRATVVTMILETDLAVHQESVKSFRRSFLEEEATVATDLAKRRQLLSYMLKTCDVGGGAKPFSLHVQWATRIATEFFQQGDQELKLGLPCSPFCDRRDTKISESQHGFFQFIVSPLITTLNGFLLSRRVDEELLSALEENRSFWLRYGTGTGCFNYKDPMASIPELLEIFRSVLPGQVA